jgi:hypothetical protein
MFDIAQRANQLGNRLFLFTHVITCAVEHRVALINLGFAEYAHYFESTPGGLLCGFPARHSALRNRRAYSCDLADAIGRFCPQRRMMRTAVSSVQLPRFTDMAPTLHEFVICNG